MIWTISSNEISFNDNVISKSMKVENSSHHAINLNVQEFFLVTYSIIIVPCMKEPKNSVKQVQWWKIEACKSVKCVGTLKLRFFGVFTRTIGTTIYIASTILIISLCSTKSCWMVVHEKSSKETTGFLIICHALIKS